MKKQITMPAANTSKMPNMPTRTSVASNTSAESSLSLAGCAQLGSVVTAGTEATWPSASQVHVKQGSLHVQVSPIDLLGSSRHGTLSAWCNSSTTSTAKLQAVLAAAHKYQVPRLQLWTEQQLCGVISCEMVCSLLGLAHVYEATALERNCLEFMAANMANVVARPDFTSLSADCLVKFNMHCAGVEPAGPSGGVKRKRGEMGA